MHNNSLLFLTCCFALSLSAQQTVTPQFASEFTIGINATNTVAKSDDPGTGLYLDVSVQKFVPLGQRLLLSGGLGLYTTIFHYNGRSSLSFACDAPVAFGGQGQQTFVEANTFHAGLQIPVRLQATLGPQHRFNIFAGASVLVPVVGFIREQIVECGTIPYEENTTSGLKSFRSIIPEFTFGFGYGVKLPKAGGIMYVGPFFSTSADTHTITGEQNLHPDLRTYTIGIKASGRKL